MSHLDIEQLRTFLAVAAKGNFIGAATHLHVARSTVTARIQNLEACLCAKLFAHSRLGGSLTPAGKRFLRHAQTLLLTMEQARQEIGLPGCCPASLTVGACAALWDAGFLPEWVGRIRAQMPDTSIRCEVGFEEDLMRWLVERTLDIGLMYAPLHAPGLQAEFLFDEILVLMGTAPEKPWQDESYVYVDWGGKFHTEHQVHFPELECQPLRANIGWLAAQLVRANGGACFLPKRVADQLVAKDGLWRIAGTPGFCLPTYAIYPGNPESRKCQQAMDILRNLVMEVVSFASPA